MKLEHVIKYFGTQVAAADAIGVSQPTLSNWKTRGRIPHIQQLKLQHVSGGKLKADPLMVRKVSRA